MILKKRVHHTLVLILEIFYTRNKINKYNGLFADFFFFSIQVGSYYSKYIRNTSVLMKDATFVFLLWNRSFAAAVVLVSLSKHTIKFLMHN